MSTFSPIVTVVQARFEPCLREEKVRITRHQSPYLTNIIGQAPERIAPAEVELLDNREPDEMLTSSVDLTPLRKRLTYYWAMPASKRFQQPEYLDDCWLWEEHYPFFGDKEMKLSDRLFWFCDAMEMSECNWDEENICIVRTWYHKKCQEMNIEPNKFLYLYGRGGH